MQNNILPTIEFKISAERDVETFFCFVRDAEYDDGENIKWAILKPYPELVSWFKGTELTATRDDVCRFVNLKYNSHAKEMASNLIVYQRDWDALSPRFEKLTKDLFEDAHWPNGKYIAYLTIWGMYPRFLETCTFQIPWKHQIKGYVPVVIAHEMLHFIWYAFAFDKLPYLNKMDDFKVWHISEIFNSFVQNSDAWISVFKQPSMQYPVHENILNNLKSRMPSIENLKTLMITKAVIKAVEDDPPSLAI
ncbi:MAG TPA: hypothetical protein PLF71_03485 [bacterium]|nr:MAG: hypothetical protein BWY14_00140 [Parcubacteria group bacterium ADurb.Bin192]HPN15150.1 hypothetical protein [bacterium]